LSQLVLDCSVAISWSFLDENNAYADLVLAMISDTTAIVPAIFYWEITNTLLVGERRQRISFDDALVNADCNGFTAHRQHFGKNLGIGAAIQ